ncbi:replication initiation protein [Aliarcobacter butzleri]
MSNNIIVKERPRHLEPEIFKQNNLIECSFEELTTWSEIHHDLLNELIAIFQNYDHQKTLFSDLDRRIFIRRSTLEKNICIRRKTNKEIYDLLKKMRDTSFTIKGIYQLNGYKTQAAISFFEKVFLHEMAGRESYFEIEYSELFSMLCHKDYSLKYGNYCKLNLLKITSLKSKYAKALLELIESNKYKKQITFTEKELKSFLRYEVKHYRFAGLIREVSKVYESVNSHVKFTYSINKRTKSTTFKIEQ